MKLCMFSVFDAAINAYLPPWFIINDGAALRLFDLTCRDEKHAFCQSPHDYTLFRLGEFDDETAEFVIEKVALATALEIKAKHAAAARIVCGQINPEV